MVHGPPPTRLDASSDAELPGWSPGARVGEHVLEERLGSGGMGVVFAARHVTTSALHVIKVLTADAPDLRARFQREAEALSRVDGHPHVARVHAAGEHRGRPYLVMEHLAGGDLAERLRRGPLPPAEAVRVILAVCDGLAHVHARGVLHRDLKPGNVLFDERGCPKLADFGLARGARDDALTRTGEVVGTPSYMAPEQADGRPERAADLLDRGPELPLRRVRFAALLWEEVDDPEVRRRALEVLRRALAENGPARLAAGYYLARIRRLERELGLPPSLTATEAKRLLEEALQDPVVADSARGELRRLKE